MKYKYFRKIEYSLWFQIISKLSTNIIIIDYKHFSLWVRVVYKDLLVKVVQLAVLSFRF